MAPHLDLPSGERLVPYSATNNLLVHKVVLLPSEPEEYGTDAELLEEIRSFIHHHVALTPRFEAISAYYVLFSWLYDRFNELPYLRVRGDYGSGKSRFLLTVGSLCYKPMFVSGASTVSPIFRTIDAFRGTLVIDESDFKESDERNEIVKIFNQGNARGFPVLRSEQVGNRKEFDVRAYTVFGPKLIATRRDFKDRALESRCLTEEMGQVELRKDIPINLPAGFEGEALGIRNKLLAFRLRAFGRERRSDSFTDQSIEPRLRQVFSPLLAVIDDPAVREEVVDLARHYQKEIVADRGLDVEAAVLEAVYGLQKAGKPLAVKEITALFLDEYGEEFGGKATPRWVGSILRRRLGLRPVKSNGVYVIPPGEGPKLARLFGRYGLEEGSGRGDVGDVEAVPVTGGLF
ncbi:MAG TPA: hypothetical protein VLB76_26785 [Thermoanaerobaculia bacterium]|nr:hypothetical protein [Thermoanaerobaculia bacterium]